MILTLILIHYKTTINQNNNTEAKTGSEKKCLEIQNLQRQNDLLRYALGMCRDQEVQGFLARNSNCCWETRDDDDANDSNDASNNNNTFSLFNNSCGNNNSDKSNNNSNNNNIGMGGKTTNRNPNTNTNSTNSTNSSNSVDFNALINGLSIGGGNSNSSGATTNFSNMSNMNMTMSTSPLNNMLDPKSTMVYYFWNSC